MRRLRHGSDGYTPAGLFLLLLLGADAAFIGVHLVDELSPTVDNRLYALHVDRSYSEVFQYLQLLWITGLLVLVGWVRRAPVHGAWALLFAYLAADDALRIHERTGAWLTTTWSLQGAWGLQGQDFGELAASAGAGLVLFALIGAGYVRSARPDRRASQDLGLLLGLLVFFGVFFDLIHVMVEDSFAGAACNVLEDGGEMIAASLTVAYVYRLRLARGITATSWLQWALAPRSLTPEPAPASQPASTAP